MTDPKRERPGRDGHRATGRQGETSNAILAHRATAESELRRLERDESIPPRRRTAALETLRRALGSVL